MIPDLGTMINLLYPDAQSGVDYEVRDKSDGKGPYISFWNLPTPKPTEEMLLVRRHEFDALKAERDKNKPK